MLIEISPFVAALHDEDPHIRARAAEILGKLRYADAIPPLVEAMFDNGNLHKFDAGPFVQKNVQEVAIEALMEIGRDPVVEVFSQLLAHEDLIWRTRAVALLRQLALRERDQRHPIIRILQTELQNPELEMRMLIMEALRAIIIEDNQR